MFPPLKGGQHSMLLVTKITSVKNEIKNEICTTPTSPSGTKKI